MTALTIAPAIGEDEVHTALRLAISVFKHASELSDYESYKTLLWYDDPTFALENIMLARLGDGSPCGLIRIVPRTVYRVNEAYSVAGISSVCLKPDKQGRGLSIDLMERTLDSCRTRGFDFAFLFARRSADHYYTRFGFSGIGSYSRISIRLSGLRTDSNIALQDEDEAYIDLYSEAYNRCYAGVFGRVERSPDYWRFMLRRVRQSPGLRFLTLTASGSPVGYALLGDDAVHELGYRDGVQADAVLTLISEALPQARTAGLLTLRISPQHLFVGAAYGFDMTVSSRECTYGGHMACILNPKSLLDRMAGRAPAVALELERLAKAKHFTHRDTCHLLGVWSPSDLQPSGQPVLPYDMSSADEF